jgi:hypothetical protein
MRSFVALLVGVLVAVSVMVWAPAAVAQEEGAKALIAKGQDLFDEQRYDESIQTLSAVVARKDIPPEQRIAALKLMAYNHIVLGNLGQAKGVVWSIYAEDEDYELGEEESPRFRDFFKKHKKSWIEAGRPGKATATEPVNVKIKHSPPAEAEAGLAISLSGVVEDPDAKVAQMRVYYRTGTDGKFEFSPVKFTMRKFTVDIPADYVESPVVEYYIQALDGNGLPVATRGDAEAPLRVRVPGEEGGALSAPALWVPVGIGIAVTLAVTIPLALFFSGNLGGSQGESTVTVTVFER